MNQGQEEVQQGSLKCQEHDQEVILINCGETNTIEERLLCALCFKNLKGSTTIIKLNSALSIVKQKYDELNKSLGSQMLTQQKLIYTCQQKTLKLRQTINYELDQIESQLKIWNDIILRETKMQNQNIYNDISYVLKVEKKIQFDHVDEVKKILNDYQNQFYQSIPKQLQRIEEQLIDLKSILGDQQQIIYQNNLKISQTYNNENQQQKVQYKNTQCISSLETSTINSDWCWTSSFNRDNTILACGIGKEIIIFDIKNGNLQQLTKLLNHTDDVFCIIFSKKSNFFISAGCDKSIICWKENTLNKWQGSNTYQEHSNFIFQILLNKTEDQLISCSCDSSIKIWKVDQELNLLTYVYQLQNGHNNSVNSINLNFQEDILLSTSDDKTVIMWKIDKQSNKWTNTYMQQFNDWSNRAGFIEDKLFALQTFSNGVMHIFKIEGNKFIQIKNLSLQLNNKSGDDDLIQIKYNQQKQLLFNKHDKYIYILQNLSDGKFQIIEQIDCNNSSNFGSISNNFEYISNWDYSKKTIRLFKVNFQQ